MKTGLYGKYTIAKADGSEIDPKAKYFVLRLDTDPAARIAARAYAVRTQNEELWDDISAIDAEQLPTSTEER
jgi:hypothetical protein